jgi:hypothetical protein
MKVDVGIRDKRAVQTEKAERFQIYTQRLPNLLCLFRALLQLIPERWDVVLHLQVHP